MVGGCGESGVWYWWVVVVEVVGGSGWVVVVKVEGGIGGWLW